MIGVKLVTNGVQLDMAIGIAFAIWSIPVAYVMSIINKRLIIMKQRVKPFLAC